MAKHNCLVRNCCSTILPVAVGLAVSLHPQFLLGHEVDAVSVATSNIVKAHGFTVPWVAAVYQIGTGQS